MKLDRLVKLERRLAGWFDRSLRNGAETDPIELVPLILDHVEEHVQPTADGGRVFPYDRVSIQVCVEQDRLAAFRAAFGDAATLEERIRGRLREVRCVPPALLKVVARLVQGPAPDTWGGLPFRIDYHDRRARVAPPPADTMTVPAIRIAVLAGNAGARSHVFELERINIGRMRRIAGAGAGAARHNHLAFADDEGEANATVSRVHAHILLDRDAGGFRLFDDGSAQGTRVLRAGRSLAVPKRGSRGVRLEHGDEIEFGAARVRFLTRWPERGGGDATGGGEEPRSKRAEREG